MNFSKTQANPSFDEPSNTTIRNFTRYEVEE
jgi:hypothetical protein